MLKDLNHSNIVNLIEAGQGEYRKKSGKAENKYYLVMELAEGGELFEYVSSTGPFSHKVCRYYYS
jgi:serine/threonine protein kinase